MKKKRTNKVFNTRPLLLGPKEKERMQKVKDYAFIHPFDVAGLEATMGDPSKSAGYIEDLRAEYDTGFRVVYSVEEHPQGWSNHISVSVAGHGCNPHPAAFKMLTEFYGFRFKTPFDKDATDLSMDDGGVLYTQPIFEEKLAINIIQLRGDDEPTPVKYEKTTVGKTPVQ